MKIQNAAQFAIPNASNQDWTVLIHGQLNSDSLSIGLIPYYAMLGKVIVSHWDTETKFSPKAQQILASPDVRIIRTTQPDVTNFHNYQNIYYQMTTILAGLRQVTTPYVIKTRSDQSIANLQPVMDSVKKYPEILTTSNLFLREDRVHKFHLPDCLIAGRTSILLAMYEKMKLLLEDTKLPFYNQFRALHGGVSGPCAEQTLFVAYAETKGFALDFNRSVIQLLENINMVTDIEIGLTWRPYTPYFYSLKDFAIDGMLDLYTKIYGKPR